LLKIFSIINFFLFKAQLAELKKSGGAPVVIIQYKEEIEAILDKDRPTLNPKSCIDSSESSLRKEEDLNIQERLTDKNQMETSHTIPKFDRKHKNKRENNDAEAMQLLT